MRGTARAIPRLYAFVCVYMRFDRPAWWKSGLETSSLRLRIASQQSNLAALFYFELAAIQLLFWRNGMYEDDIGRNDQEAAENEEVNATDSTEGQAGGSILEIGAWVYRR